MQNKYATITEKFYQIVVNGNVEKEYSKSYLIERRKCNNPMLRKLYLAKQLIKATKLFPNQQIELRVENRVYQQVTPVNPSPVHAQIANAPISAN